MAEIVGPLISQVVEKPVIIIGDSKKNAEVDGVTLKIAGDYGATEFSIENIAEIYQNIGDFLTMKGVNPSIESAAAQILRHGAGLLVTD